ncbi:SGNH/GDSL hydrolase family protein [Variovorax ginsengisoli]|uniref:SGNH hydrolase-type esterase domain-containing protein n=1 Tax=Variovorax ginsengisoli TaxID=363844 RepID=A0ABT8S113_9BURK|nr:GDSL-type esterase/lipase family protein [Variovorax ginsengisoli]MDN8612792.1 hypothetical protein [Variovorax ginsengisoli]MDO1531962.1 hypothetical protein [Variovorax ginsengisoli]
MAIKVKVGGVYTDTVGVFSKNAGVYSAVAGLSAKVGGVYVRADAAVDPLARFKASVLAGTGKVYMSGDSTTLVANQMWSQINEQITAPGGEWGGVTVVNGGANGQTLEGQLAQSMGDIYASAATLVIGCWLINDVRQGARTVAQMQANLLQFIDGIKTNLPGADILMWTPNSFQLTDPQAYGYVVPLASAQDYTDRIWQAYENVRLTAPANVAFVDKQQVFGRVLVDVNPLLQDILHPNNTGQTAAMIPMIQVTTPTPPPINLTASAAAWASNPNNPWTIYSRALEDTRYCTVVKRMYCDTWADLGANYLYYWAPRWNDPSGSIQVADLQPLDFIGTANGNCQLTGSETKSDLDVRRIQIQIPIANGAPSNTPGLAYGTVYRKLP